MCWWGRGRWLGGSGSGSGLLAVEILAWGEDVDVAEGMQDEQVLIAGEDEVGVAGEREGEEFVVFGVAAGGDGCDAFDQSGREL